MLLKLNFLTINIRIHLICVVCDEKRLKPEAAVIRKNCQRGRLLKFSYQAMDFNMPLLQEVKFAVGQINKQGNSALQRLEIVCYEQLAI